MHKKKHKSIVSILLCIAMLAGCGSLEDKKNLKEEEKPENILLELPEEKEFFYDVPVMKPSVLVDQVGYETKSKKTAIFRGKNLIDTFEVIDAESGEIVYTGEIVTRRYDEKTEEYTNFGSFTELDKNGTYYIQTPIIGQSYPFVIGEDIYSALLPEVQKILFYERCGFDLEKSVAGEYARDACHLKSIKAEGMSEPIDVSGGWHTGEDSEKDVTEGTTIVTSLLLAYELYPKQFMDDTGIAESKNQIPDILDEIKYEIEWLLKMQSSKTGGVFDSVRNFQISKEATANFSGVMAGFYQIYKEYDVNYAKKCLNAGIRAWKYQQSNEKNTVPSQEMYFAATQLYRATGEISYSNYIRSYFRTDKEAVAGDSTRELYGDIIYLMTRRKVDTVVCKNLMDKWMEKAEEIVSEAQSNAYFVAGDSNDEMLDNMFCLSLIGHIITNHEYATILENHLHYFLGRNEQGVSYIQGIGQKYPIEGEEQDFITKQPQKTAILIFMLGEIVNEDLEIDKK